MNQGRNQILLILTLAGILFSATSCKKEEGVGGTSTIMGKVFARTYNSGGIQIDSFYVPDERVYLIYGDDEFYGEELRTHYDGTYRFQYLYKGNYTVYAYSECDTCSSGLQAIFQTIEIKKNGEVLTLPDIVIRK